MTYFSGPRKSKAVYWDEDMKRMVGSPENIVVFEPENEPTDTGLITTTGLIIYRTPSERSVGFRTKK